MVLLCVGKSGLSYCITSFLYYCKRVFIMGVIVGIIYMGLFGDLLSDIAILSREFLGL